ncbi:MAG TPA: two-component regulator propeller domain-containing protein, partial [Blastocatellia bacterium]|nr:two-component regulator propeller domain-containing protein [Blastocatellia bacterium]
TEEGLSRFDGYKFTNYTTAQALPSRQVLDLLETRAGVYWVATGEGLCRFNPNGVPRPQESTTRNKNDAAAAKPLFAIYRPDGVVPAEVSVLFEDHAGRVWLGTPAGLFRLEASGDGVQFHFVDLGMPARSGGDRHVLAIAEDQQGALWVGVHSSGLYRYWVNGRVERYTVRDGLPSDGVRSLLVDRAGRVWVGTPNGLCQLVQYPAPDRPVVARVYTERDGLASGWIYTMFQSPDGRLWVGSNGLNEFISEANGTGQSFRHYTNANGVSGQEVWALTEDRNGNLWLGTKNGGAIKLARNGFTTFGVADGLGESGVNTIFEDQAGELCIISGEKGKPCVQRFEGKELITAAPRYPPSITVFGWGWNQFGLQDKRGEWWFPTGQGLCRFPKVTFEQLAHVAPEAVYTIKDGLVSGDVFRLFEDSRGDIWISTDSPVKNGLSRWERTTETMRDYSQDIESAAANPSGTLVTSFAEDAVGNLWIGHDGGGLIRYTAGHFSFFTKADGAPTGWIRAIYLDHADRLWVASGQGGLSRIDDPQAEHPRFITYTTVEGLSSDQVNCVTENQWGHIYAGTGRGVDRLDPATGHIKHYTSADGLISGEVLTAFRDRQGALWFGSGKGLSRFEPAPDLPPPPPPILIDGLKIGSDSQRLSALGETEIPMLELAPDRNQIQIEFVGLSFGSGETLRYEYKLEAADKDWSAPAETRTVNFSNLAPGSYRFLVKAVTAEGIESATPAVFPFTILRPFWQRWWFLTLAAILAGLAVYAAYGYRVAQLLELERVRTRIATDLHDDIGASLSRMAILSEVVKRQVGSAQVSVPMLTEIADSARGLVSSMRDIVWSIDPRRDDLNSLISRVRQFAYDVLEPQGVKCEFEVPSQVGGVRLGPDERRHLFLIFKEAINNISRHAECSSVLVRLAIEHSKLKAEVRDDGRGFMPPGVEPSAANGGEGHGLNNMRARAAQLGGSLTIHSSRALGTTLELIVPLRRR